MFFVSVGAGIATLERTAPMVSNQLSAASEFAQISFFDFLSGAYKTLTRGVSNLKQIALERVSPTPRVPAESEFSSLNPLYGGSHDKKIPNSASTTTRTAITQQSVELDLGTYKSELKSELEKYLEERLTTYYQQPTTVINQYLNPIELRREILLADTRPVITRQSDAEGSRRSSTISSLTDGGRFSNAVLTDSTITGSGGTLNEFIFTNATGTTLLTTTATTTTFYANTSTIAALNITGNASVGGSLTVSGSTVTIGQLLSTRVPTLAHVFSPSFPSSTSNVSDSTIYINPASAAADTNIFGAAVAGTVKFLVDAEGDIYGNNLVLAGSTSQGATTIAGNLTIQDGTTFGDSSTDTATSSAQFLALASTTLQNFTFRNATGTSATTTDFATTNVCISNDCRSAWPSVPWNWTKLSTNEQATSTTLLFTNGIVSTASSTLASNTISNLLITSSATSSNFYSTNFLVSGSSTLQNFSGQTGTLANLLLNGSSTLQNFTASNATTTNATTTTLAVSGSTLSLRGVLYTLPSADGSSGQVLTTNGSGVLSWSTKTEGISEDFKGLSLRTSPNADVATTTVVLDHADEIVMDTGNRVATWDDLSANIASSGAGGLDTGSEAASTWYEIYAIRKSSDGTKNLLLHRAKDYFLDENETTDNSSVRLRRSSVPTRTKLAQGFQQPNTGYVEFFDVLLDRDTAVPGRGCLLFEADGAGSPRGAPLATSDKLDASLIALTAQWVRFVFRTPVSLTAATQYHLVFQGDYTASDTVTINWHSDNSPGYANGILQGLDAGTWADTTEDAAFKVYVTENDTSVTMPTGYDQKAHVGYVYNDGGSNFNTFTAIDHHVVVGANNFGTISATIGTLTDVSIAIPPVPVVYELGASGDSSTAWGTIAGVPNGYALNSGASTATTLNNGGRFFSYNSVTNLPFSMGTAATEFQAIYVSMSSGAAEQVHILGYTWGSSGGADIAEEYLVNDESISAGDLVSLSTPKFYIEKSTASSSYPVFGVVSTKPGIRLKDWDYNPQNNRAVALAGRVPVKVSEENGIINVGDRLTLSATIPGVAMKQTEPGQSIGIAMESSENKDKVITFLNMTYWVPTLIEDTENIASGSLSFEDPPASPLDNLMAYVVRKFKDAFEIVFENGLVRVAKGVFTELEAQIVKATTGVFGTVESQNGVTTYDRITGEPYCIGV